MDDAPCRRFFLEPNGIMHRQYEALRAVFVDGRSQKEVADQFGYTYDALRQLVSQFRARCAAGDGSPFLPSHAGDGGPAGRRTGSRPARKSRRRPTSAP
jgi:hypothetical protein